MANFLREFSLVHFDLPTIFRNVGVLLRVLTININRQHTQPISLFYYIFAISGMICYIYGFIFSLIWFVLVRCPETGDFTAAMVVTSVTMCSAFCIPKILYMKYYKKTVMSIVDQYLECNELMVKGTRFETNVLKALSLIKKQATAAWTILFVNVLIYLLVPYLRPGRHLTEDLLVLYGLEPMFESPNYEIASLVCIISIFFSSIAMVHITIFIIVLVGFLEAQMMSLSEEMNNIWKDSEKFYNYYKNYNRAVEKNKIRNIFLKIRLNDILKFQILNINLRNKVEKELRFIFVTDFIFIIVALVSELLGGVANTFIQLPFTFVVLFIDCYIGQRLIDAGTVFEKAVYSCKWENFNVSNQKIVLFMLQCSQKTMILTAGGVAVLNFPSLMYILRSTYSAYTTLNSST